MAADTVESVVRGVIPADQATDEWDIQGINEVLLPIAPIAPLNTDNENYRGYSIERLIDEINEKVLALYEEKEKDVEEETGSPDTIREVERVFLLKTIDQKWMAHIDDLDQLRNSVTLKAYAQKDPVVEYRYAAIDMFNDMIASISEQIVRIMLHIRKQPTAEREQVAKVTGTNKDASAAGSRTVRRTEKKVGPNDPCPCGKRYPDGRPIKYKNCCGRNK